MAIKLKNNASTNLAADITAADTSILVDTGSVFATLTNGDYFYCTLANSDNTTTEIVKVREVTGNTLTVERGAEGTTAFAFVTGETVEQRATVQTLMDLTTTRVYLDEVNIGFEDQPVITASKIAAIAQRTAPYLLTHWDTYFGSRLKNVIFDITNDVILEDGIQFSTVADIANWLSTNYPGNTPTLVMKPYETESQSIPTLTKMYGMNRFFSSLKGRRGNGKTSSVISSGLISQANLDTIFNSTHSISGAANVTENSFWIANNKKNMYGALYKGAHIKHSPNNSGQHRGEYTVATTTFNNITIGSDFRRRPMGPKELHMTHSMNISIQNPDVFYHPIDNVSRLLAYPLERNDGATYSIMLKPIGMDCFVMELPDFTHYSFEAVAYNNNIQGSTQVKIFNNTTDFIESDFDYTNGKMRIDVSNFVSLLLSVSQRSGNSNYSDWTTLNTIRFRLRDKTTNAISELSKFGIVYDARHKYGTFRFMVKHFNS